MDINNSADISQAGVEARREYYRKWRKENADRYNEYHRRWRKNNPDKVRAICDRYWERKAVAMPNATASGK